MPLHLKDRDIISEIQGTRSALIVPCQMCPAVTVAIRNRQPFIQIFKTFLRSPPFERYIEALKARLKSHGVKTDVFWNRLPHQWFLCMWTWNRCKKLKKCAQPYELIIVLGCTSATETVRNSIDANDCIVVEGMQTAGITNATLGLKPPGDVIFQDCNIIPVEKENHKQIGNIL